MFVIRKSGSIMNENHRKLIERNLAKLVDCTEYKTVMDACLQKDILTETMYQIIETDGKTEDSKKELLYRKLIHRGPTAFNKILKIMEENGYDEAYKVLNASTIPSATFTEDEASYDDVYLSISNTMSLHANNKPAAISPQNLNNVEKVDQPDKKTSSDGPCLSKNQSRKDLKLEPYNEPTAFQVSNLEVKKAASYGSHPKLQVYSMKTKKRGVFFFVNIINFDGKKPRSGAEKDRDNLVTLFREMNYTVFYYEDLNRPDFLMLMKELVASKYLNSIDSFVCCVQTHGDFYDNMTVMEFSDGLSISTEDVIRMFSNTNCQALVYKPKIFFFPFCRGGISDLENRVKFTPNIETDGRPPLVPTYNDILICYGTVPGFTTHRDVNFGSWYVKELCKVFAEHACDCHIEEMLKMISTNTMNIRDSGRVQVASTESRGFDKLLFFNPKISG